MYLAKLTHQTHGAQRTQPKQQVNSKTSNRAELSCLGRMCVKPGINKHLEIEIIQQGDTPLKHLGKSLWINLDTEINHHQVETKGPRTPLEVPNSRYRTRCFGEERTLSSLISKLVKSVYILVWEEYLSSFPCLQSGQLVNTSKRKAKVILH